MKNHIYYIDTTSYAIELDDTQEYITGSNIILSNEESDVTYFQNWYSQGYTIQSFLSNDEFNKIKQGVTQCVKNLIENTLNIQISSF